MNNSKQQKNSMPHAYDIHEYLMSLDPLLRFILIDQMPGESFSVWDRQEIRQYLEKKGYKEVRLNLHEQNTMEVIRKLRDISGLSKKTKIFPLSENLVYAGDTDTIQDFFDIEVEKLNESEYSVRYNSALVSQEDISQLEKQLRVG